MIRNDFKKIRLERKGQTLLLSLLILASVSAAGIGFATLIINLIQGAENIDNSISAFYGAESGMEQGLYLVKSYRRDGRALGETAGALRVLTKTNFSTPGLEVVTSKVGWTEENHTFFLAKNESEQIDLYSDWYFDPFYLWISWDNNPCESDDPNYPVPCSGGIEPCCIGSGSEWVEISWTGWDNRLNSYENVEKVLLSSHDLYYDEPYPGGSATCPSSDGVKQCAFIPLNVFPLPPGSTYFYYQVRVKALYDKIDDLEVRVADDGHVLSPLPSRLSLKTVGKFGRSQQALDASMPWHIPTSGLFDYVIFTEKELKKIPGSP